MLVDAHLHLDLCTDYPKVIQEIEANAIHSITVTNVPSVFKKTCEIVEGSKYIHPALGFHPELVKARFSEFYLFEELCQTSRFIGEIGLDFSTVDTSEIKKQEEIFTRIIKLSASCNKILSIHSRRSAERVVELIEKGFPATVILHWYTGPVKTLIEAVRRGFYFSINPLMTFTDRGREIIKNIPVEQLLLESDAPLANIQGKEIRPLDVKIALEPLSKIYKCSEIEEKIFNNFLRIINGDKNA